MSSVSRATSSGSPSNHSMQLPMPFISDKEKTFQYDEDCPPLPVPPLERTLHKYLQYVKVHLSDEDYEQTKNIVEKFAAGQGKELHFQLLDKAKKSKNWLAKWWDDYAYLANREPHNPYVNFAGPSPYVLSYWPPEDGVQTKRAGLALWSGMKYWQAVFQEKLAVDRGGMKEKCVWSMWQFRRMFNACKIPGEHMDSFRFNFKTQSEGGGDLTQIMILCKGRIFTFDGVDADLQPLTAPEYELQLRRIQESCAGRAAGPGLGALTGHRRTEWYQAREHLLSLHPDNAKNMDVIEKAIFAYVIDEHEPKDLSEICKAGLIGDSRNRWFDKSMCHISFKNGVFSCNCDHAPHDAMVMVSATLWSHMVLGMNGGEWQGTDAVRELPQPEELVFHLDDTMYKHIDDALQVYKKAEDSIELLSAMYTGYGRQYLRKMKVHPDAQCQIAGQYAYFRLYGKPAATYETASSRKFYNARTETLRSCTQEAMTFAKKMMDDNATKVEQLQCLKAAFDTHNQAMVDCQNGMGIDRHLFGLQMLAFEQGMDTPEIFTDPAWTKSGGGGNFTMSTSFVGYTEVFGGVAPMCKDGYGYFYAIQNDRISYWITTWTADVHTNAKMFHDTVVKCMDEMRDLLEYGAKLAGKEGGSSAKL